MRIGASPYVPLCALAVLRKARAEISLTKTPPQTNITSAALYAKYSQKG